MQTAPFRTLCAMTLVAGISCLADGPGPRRRRSTTAPGRLRGRRPARSRSRLRHARRQDRKTEKPPPKRLPRLRCMGLRPPRRMDRILRKTRTRRHAPRPLPIPRHTTRIPHQTRCVNPVAPPGGSNEKRKTAETSFQSARYCALASYRDGKHAEKGARHRHCAFVVGVIDPSCLPIFQHRMGRRNMVSKVGFLLGVAFSYFGDPARKGATTSCKYLCQNKRYASTNRKTSLGSPQMASSGCMGWNW